jgi:hypothetical protein
MAIRLAVDLKLFDAISNCHGAFNLEQLQIEADPQLASKLASILDPCAVLVLIVVGRIMQFLAAMFVIHEVDVDKYTTTPLAAALLSTSPISAAIIHGYDSSPEIE